MYESSFQLSKRPFGAAPQVADYYPSTACESARKTLMRCVERNSGPSLLIGGPGSGKSILCLKLQEHFQLAMPTAYVSSCGIRTRRELLQQILFAFDRPYTASDEGELRISLTNFVYSHNDGNVTLVLDDADDLPSELMEEVRSLSNLTQDGGWSINLILAGKSKLEESVGQPGMESLEQRIASRNYLHAWNRQETTDYVRFQISRADGDADQVFSDGAFDQLFDLSDGLPRLVNQICDHSMIMAALGDIQRLDAIHLEEAWADLQQLPSPSRTVSIQGVGDESKEAVCGVGTDAVDDSMIEFGSLDDGDAHESNELPEPTCGPFDQMGSDVVGEVTECTHDLEEPAPPGDESTCDVNSITNIQIDSECDAGEHDCYEQGSDRQDPNEQDQDNEMVVETEPQLEADCASADAGEHCESDFGEQADTVERQADLRLAPSSQGDLIDRLDDIEREVQRVSNELRGDDDGGNEPAEPNPAQSNNPFLEIFDEEEIVFGTHNTMNNELVRRQPAVFTSGGDALIQVIRMVDQGPTPNDWELHDDITGSQPAEQQLSLELASLPVLSVRHAPEIADTNVCGNQFANDEFSFGYTVDAEPKLEELGSAMENEADAGLNALDFDDDHEDLHSLDRPGEIDAERDSMLLSSLDCCQNEGACSEDRDGSSAGNEFGSGITHESLSESESDYLRRYALDDSNPRDAVISGSEVGSDAIERNDGEPASYESSDDLVFSSPSLDAVESDETLGFAEPPNGTDGATFSSSAPSVHQQDESQPSFEVEVQPDESLRDVEDGRFRQPKDQLEPIEQAMILPENHRGQFSNNTKFGYESEAEEQTEASISFEENTSPDAAPGGSSTEGTATDVVSSRDTAPRRSSRPFKNLFSKLKANESE